MAKRQSSEAIILEYFQTSSAEKVEVMFNLVKGVIRKQHPAIGKRKRVAKKTNQVNMGTIGDLGKVYAGERQTPEYVAAVVKAVKAADKPSKQTSFEPEKLV